MVRVRVVFKHDTDTPEISTLGDEVSRVLRTRGEGSRRNSVCIGGGLEEIAEEEEEFMFRLETVNQCSWIHVLNKRFRI